MNATHFYEKHGEILNFVSGVFYFIWLPGASSTG